MSKQNQAHTQPQAEPPQAKTARQEGLETAVAPLPAWQYGYADPRAVAPDAINTLQRTIGNQALRRLHRQRQEEEVLPPSDDPLWGGGELSEGVETAVTQAKSGGQPLSNIVRKPMEQAFNADFSRVKIHTNRTADSLNRSLSARAFTSGQDIFFRAGAYNPGSSSGQELLAHELTHTIQQSGAPIRRQPAATKLPTSLSLPGGLGAVSPHLIQRAQAIANKNQATYKPDPEDGDKVLNTSVRGTRRTNHTIDHYQNFTVVDQPAPNKANYHKITGAPYPGEFAYRPNFTQINAHNETKVVKQPTHIKDGKSGDAWEAAQPGDILEVTGQTEDNSYYFARNKRFPNGKRGTIAQEKTVDRNGGLDTPGVPLTNAANAATTDSSVPLYKPLSDDRQKSVGTDGEFGRFHRSGIDLEVDLTAAGLDTAGKKSLVVAQSVRQPDKKGYIEKDKVRIITDTTAALTQEYQSQPGNQGAQLERITTDFVVTGKTILRQPQEDSNGVITFKDSYELEPGEILQHTAESRAVFKQDKMWATEMKWQGKYMGMINMEKAQALPDDQKAILKLNTPVDGVRDKATLQKVLVTDKTTLRAIKGNRIHSFAIGSKTVALKPDTAVYVDFSIKGVDETFNYAWVFAQTDEDAFGYIREEKITNPHTEGKVRETTWGGKQIEGNEIPVGNQYIYKIDSEVGKRGDRFVPVPHQAVATNTHYFHLRNRRNGKVCRIQKENVLLASLPLVTANPPNTTALVLGKAHLRQPVENRIHNSGASDQTVGDPLLPGDKLLVNFQTAGIFAKGDTEWYYASKNNNFGYIRGSKVRESGAEQLQAINQGATPDQFIPAYVSSKAHLRDARKSKKEEKKAGDQIMVNYGRHPVPYVRKGNSTNYVSNPYFTANELNRWLLVQGDSPRYIREHKVTVQFLQPEYKPPSAEKSSGAAYQAFKIISGGVKSVNFESAGGWGVGTTGDIYEGFKGVKGMEEGQEIESGFLKNPSDGPAHGGEYHNLAIAGVTGGLLGLIGTVEGLIEVFGPGRNWKQRLLGMLKITESGLSGVVASARAAENIYAIQDSRLKSSSTAMQSDNYEAFKLAGEVAGWAAGIANAIGAVKGLFLSIHSFVTSHKKAPERGVSLLKGILEAGQAGVKAARFLTKVFDATGASNVLAVTVPFIGLAVDMADIVLGAFKTYHGHTGESDAGELLREHDLKQKVINSFNSHLLDTSDPHKNEKNKLFWKEFRGVRSVNTLMTKTSYLRLNPKIMFAIRNKEQLDKRDAVGANNVVERSPRYINSDYYQVVDNLGQPTGTVVAILDGAHIAITPAAQKAIREYELVSKVQEVSKKKKVYGIEEIEKGVLNLIGDVLGMGGPTAMAGAIIKGVTAAADAGFNLARFINKQMDNKSGKVYASHLKYQGKIEGTDKSQTKKKREYYDHAIFILQEIGDLANPAQIMAAAQDQGTLNLYRQQYITVQKHVEITGVHTKLFYEAAGKPVEQVELLVEALSER